MGISPVDPPGALRRFGAPQVGNGHNGRRRADRGLCPVGPPKPAGVRGKTRKQSAMALRHRGRMMAENSGSRGAPAHNAWPSGEALGAQPLAKLRDRVRGKWWSTSGD